MAWCPDPSFSDSTDKRQVKMNHTYGVKFRQSFYSEESWYEINTYGGMVFRIWGILMVIGGVLFVFIPLGDFGALFAIFLVTFATVAVPTIITYAYAGVSSRRK